MGLFGGITNFFTGGSQGKSEAAAREAVDVIGGVQLPDIDAMKVSLERQVQQGIITPEMANTVLQEQTAMSGISTDPRLKNAQMKALSGLQEVASEGGLTAIDRARLADISSEENARERGQRGAIVQGAQQRGVGGSGLELAATLANQQGSATRGAQRGHDVAAGAQARVLEALARSGSLGGHMRGQEFGEQSSIAQAKDAINRFNVANQNVTNMANVNAQNMSQYANLGEKQRIADTNVGLSNQQQLYNKNLNQQQYENDMRKRQAQASALTNQAQNYNRSADRTLDTAGNIFSSGAELMKGGGGMLAGFFSDENLKKDIKPFDASEFLNSITGHKYKYKDKKFGKGTHAGVMAQDLEKTKVGKAAVVDTPVGKMIDGGKLQNIMLASLANINTRLQEVEA